MVKLTSLSLAISKRETQIMFLIFCVFLAFRVFIMFGDPYERTFFVEEKASGYASRGMELFNCWDSGGGRYQVSGYMPAATLFTRLSFYLFDIGIWQLRLPFVLSSLIALCCFAFVLIRSFGIRFGLLSITAFCASPLLMSLNSTAVNENLFLLVISIILFLLTRLEGQFNYKKETIVILLLGLAASLSILIKIDGYIIGLTLFIVFCFRHSVLSQRKRVLTNYILGIIFGVGIYAFYIILISGLYQTANVYKFFEEVYKLNNYFNIDLYILLKRYFYDLPKNLYIFISGFLFFGILGIFLFISQWEKLSITLKFSLIMMILFLPSVSPTAWVYWKRFVIILMPFFYIAVGFIYQIKGIDNYKLDRLKIFIIILSAAIITTIANFSYFSGWTVIEPWLKNKGNVLLIASISLIVSSLIIVSRKPQITIYLLGNILSYFIILQGIFFIVNYNWRYDSSSIGRSISSIIGNEYVVADEQAFRYFGYYSKAKVGFIHENDPLYPDGIIKLAYVHSPKYIVASNGYADVSELIKKTLPNYKLIKTYHYTQPHFSFEYDRNQTISIFCSVCK